MARGSMYNMPSLTPAYCDSHGPSFFCLSHVLRASSIHYFAPWGIDNVQNSRRAYMMLRLHYPQCYI